MNNSAAQKQMSIINSVFGLCQCVVCTLSIKQAQVMKSKSSNHNAKQNFFFITKYKTTFSALYSWQSLLPYGAHNSLAIRPETTSPKAFLQFCKDNNKMLSKKKLPEKRIVKKRHVQCTHLKRWQRRTTETKRWKRHIIRNHIFFPLAHFFLVCLIVSLGRLCQWIRCLSISFHNVLCINLCALQRARIFHLFSALVETSSIFLQPSSLEFPFPSPSTK